MIIPNTDINLATEVRDVLNGAGGKVGNDIMSFFTPDANINYWNKHKPLPLSVDFCQDFDKSKPNYNQYWWKGEDGFCGLRPREGFAVTSLPGIIDGKLNGWVYVLPSGGPNSPYRLGDFAGYNTNALPMVHSLQVPSVVSVKQTTMISITAFITKPNPESITLSDLFSTGEHYPAVYMEYERNGEYRTARGSKPLSEEGFNIDVGINTDTGLNRIGKWTIYPYITNAGNNYNYTIPNLDKMIVELKETNLTIRLNAYKTTDGSQSIIWEARAVNSSGDDVTFTEGFIYLMFAGRTPDDTIIESERMIPINEISTAKGNSTTLIASGTITNIADELWNDTAAKAFIRFNPGGYAAESNILQQRPEE